jgi:hypothetical protein
MGGSDVAVAVAAAAVDVVAAPAAAAAALMAEEEEEEDDGDDDGIVPVALETSTTTPWSSWALSVLLPAHRPMLFDPIMDE